MTRVVARSMGLCLHPTADRKSPVSLTSCRQSGAKDCFEAGQRRLARPPSHGLHVVANLVETGMAMTHRSKGIDLRESDHAQSHAGISAPAARSPASADPPATVLGGRRCHTRVGRARYRPPRRPRRIPTRRFQGKALSCRVSLAHHAVPNGHNLA